MNKIDIRKLIIPVLCIFLFTPPNGFGHIGLNQITFVCKVAMYCMFFAMLIYYIGFSLKGRGQKLDSVLLLIVLFSLVLFLYTLFNSGSLYEFGFKVIYILGPWLFLAIGLSIDPKCTLKSLYYAFLIIAIINLCAVVIMYPRGSFRPEIGDYWLFGQRTYMRNILYPALLFSVLNDRLDGKKISVSTIFLLISSPVVLFAVDSKTSLILMIVIEAFVIASLFGFKVSTILRPISVIQVILDVLLVHVRKLEIFEHLIVNVLHRKMTLSGRTYVWDLVLEKIEDSPLKGTGIQRQEDSGLYLSNMNDLSNAHNELLDIWFKGGLPCVVLGAMLVIKCCIPLLKKNNAWLSFMLGLFLGAFFIEAIVSDIFYPHFFLILYLAAYRDKWESECPELA